MFILTLKGVKEEIDVVENEELESLSRWAQTAISTTLSDPEVPLSEVNIEIRDGARSSERQVLHFVH